MHANAHQSFEVLKWHRFGICTQSDTVSWKIIVKSASDGLFKTALQSH